MSGTRKFQLARNIASSTAACSPPAPKAVVRLAPPADPIKTAMDQAAADLPRLLAPHAVAEMLGVTERTLERWRITGEGPVFAKLSRSTVRYQPDDVAAFIANRLCANTAQRTSTRSDN